MSESRVVEPVPTITTTTTVPRDLLARLYREIGISAVAAALEVDRTELADTAASSAPKLPKASRLAA